VEHYNYDLAFGITYEFDITRPVNQRVTKLQYHDVNIEDKVGTGTDAILDWALKN
jgi:2',3'-cyclic-nucleotide 2'-phosphodiesterase/3'-nucleotidase